MFDKLKKAFSGKRKNENLIVLLVITVIVVISINYIWNGSKNNNKKTQSDYEKENNVALVSNNDTDDSNNLEKKLENILSKIAGVGKTKVMITYAQSSSVEPVYDENSKESNTVESDKSGGSRCISETDNQKQVVYKQNSDGSKEPITKSTSSPKIEGAIIAAEGANNEEVKSKIIDAVEAATGIPAHKIQVFEMEKSN